MITLTEGSVANVLTLFFRQRHEITPLFRFLGFSQLYMSGVVYQHPILTVETLSADTAYAGFNSALELYGEGGGIFVLKSQPALPSFFPSVEAMMGA